MDFRFTKEEEAFRQEVRGFLQKEWTIADWDPDIPEHWDAAKEFEKKLAAKGWLCMAWPEAYGGQNADVMHQLVFRDEMAHHGAPILDGQGVFMVGPCLMMHGTEEQKKRFLPPIANCEVVWCQGFSEPDAGSDLANLKTRAVKDGDDYVLNGQKIWTSEAHRGDWIHIMARTDPDAPKHKGISYFLVDMKSPGISINPIVNMTNRAGFYEVYLDNVRVPKSNMVGQENQGWYVAMTTLAFERSSIGFATQASQALERLMQYARDTKLNGKSLFEDGSVRRKFANLAIDIEVARLLAYRVAWMATRGLIPNYEASVAKVFTTELQQRLANVGMQLLGLRGQLREDSKWVALEGEIAYQYLWTIGTTIYAGSNEIQRNIIATRGLGLPRQ